VACYRVTFTFTLVTILCHIHVPIVSKSGSLNLLEPSGPVKACNGIALPLPFTLVTMSLHVSTLLRHLEGFVVSACQVT
jgi:hypothetical protein